MITPETHTSFRTSCLCVMGSAWLVFLCWQLVGGSHFFIHSPSRCLISSYKCQLDTGERLVRGTLQQKKVQGFSCKVHVIQAMKSRNDTKKVHFWQEERCKYWATTCLYMHTHTPLPRASSNPCGASRVLLVVKHPSHIESSNLFNFLPVIEQQKQLLRSCQWCQQKGQIINIQNRWQTENAFV